MLPNYLLALPNTNCNNALFSDKVEIVIDEESLSSNDTTDEKKNPKGIYPIFCLFTSSGCIHVTA